MIYNGKLIEDLTTLVDDVISEHTLDGVGIPYYNQPEGVYTPSTEGEDELEQARR